MKHLKEYLQEESVNEKLGGFFSSANYKKIGMGVSENIPGVGVKFSGVPFIGLGDSKEPIIKIKLKDVEFEGEVILSEKARAGVTLLGNLKNNINIGVFKELNMLMSGLDKETQKTLTEEQIELYREMNEEIMKFTSDMVIKLNDACSKEYKKILKSKEPQLEKIMDSLVNENKKLGRGALEKAKRFFKWIKEEIN